MAVILESLREQGFHVQLMPNPSRDLYHIEGNGLDVILTVAQIKELARENQLNALGIAELAEKLKGQEMN